ncbi:DUF4025 domain-containing protein [Halobacillus fulvus]|nr:DUF4025 domain-containing protein [Halobacillus fulvus]
MDKHRQPDGEEITHEQATDTLTEGTIDGKIDRVNKEGRLLTHDGEEIRRGKNK